MGDEKPDPPPRARPFPSRVGLSIPYQNLRYSAFQLYRRLVESETILDRATRDPSAVEPSSPDALEAWHWQTYAWAVQVFAAMTVEAALNTYGVARFGEQEFERFRWNGPVRRLRRMAKYGAGLTLEESHELCRLVASLMEKRDGIVHMQSDEELLDEHGRQTAAPRSQRDLWTDADEAVDEMEEFLQKFALLDPDPSIQMVLMVMDSGFLGPRLRKQSARARRPGVKQ